MPQYDFEYTAPKFLNRLAEIALVVGEKKSEFSVILMPDVDEIITLEEGLEIPFLLRHFKVVGS